MLSIVQPSQTVQQMKECNMPETSDSDFPVLIEVMLHEIASQSKGERQMDALIFTIVFFTLLHL